MHVVNFGHPLTPGQLAAIEELAGRPVGAVRECPASFDPGQPLAARARELVESAGLSPAEWQTAPVLVGLPGHSALAAVVLAELHGRMGYFPAVLRIRPVPEAVPPRFEVAEILRLQEVRESARARR